MVGHPPMTLSGPTAVMMCSLGPGRMEEGTVAGGWMRGLSTSLSRLVGTDVVATRKNGSRRCAEREGQVGGSGDDGIGGRRIHNNVTNPNSECPTMRRYGRRGGGLAFFLTYIVWVTSAVVTFSDINPCGCEDHRLRRKRANKVRRTSNRDRERRRMTAAVRRSVWVAVAPPRWAAGDYAGPGCSSVAAGLSALQASTDTGGRIDACRMYSADEDLSIVASVTGGVRTA